MGKITDIINNITAGQMNQIASGGTKKPSDFATDASINAATNSGKVWLDPSVSTGKVKQTSPILNYNQLKKNMDSGKFRTFGFRDDKEEVVTDGSAEDKPEEYAPETMKVTDRDDGQLADIQPGSEYDRNDTLFSGLFGSINNALTGQENSTTGAVPEGRVARTSSQGENAPLVEKRFDWQPFGTDTRNVYQDEEDNPYRNPVDMLSDDILALTNFIGGLRGTVADAVTGGERGINVGGRYYTQDEYDSMMDNPTFSTTTADKADGFYVWYTPEGKIVQAGEKTGSDPRLAEEGETPDQYDDSGRGWIFQTITLQDGTVLTRDQYDSLVKEVAMADEATDEQKAKGMPLSITMTDTDGNTYSATDMKSVDDGGKATYGRESNGFLNMAMDNPDPIGALFEGDLAGAASEFLPWMTDITLSTLPYLNPITAGLAAGSRLSAASEGYDPDTFDWRTYTYQDSGDKFKGDDGIPNDQGIANLAMPIADVASEYIGGWMPGAKALGKATGSVAKDVAKDAAMEGFEEMIPGAIGIYKDEGSNWGMNYEEDSEGNRTYLPTSFYERIGNVTPEMAENFLGGALLGAPLSAISHRGRMGKDIYNMSFRNDEHEIKLPESLRISLDEDWYKERNKED